MKKTLSSIQLRRKSRKKAKVLALIAASLAICILFGTTAWATLTFVKPTDPTNGIQQGNLSEVSESLDKKTRSRAPEPATIVLFGSGIFGMIVSFVRKVYKALKRFFDIMFSIIGLILALPICIVCALWIKLVSRGPLFFTQIRTGRDGAQFDIYKFRTMRVNAESETGAIWAKNDDNRLIAGGKFIRKTHIDEIPQFINVLKGDMSIIGPRPERPVFVDEFKRMIGDYERRLEVKPGITGLAQVWHKYDESLDDVRKKIKYDLLYIRKLCLWTDFTIILRTVRVVLTGEGAR